MDMGKSNKVDIGDFVATIRDKQISFEPDIGQSGVIRDFGRNRRNNLR